MWYGFDAQDPRIDRVVVLVHVLLELDLRQRRAHDQDLVGDIERASHAVEVAAGRSTLWPRNGLNSVAGQDRGLVLETVVHLQDTCLDIVNPDDGLVEGHAARPSSTLVPHKTRWIFDVIIAVSGCGNRAMLLIRPEGSLLDSAVGGVALRCNDDFDAPIVRTTFGTGVAGNWTSLPKTTRFNEVALITLRHDVVTHRVGSPL